MALLLVLLDVRVDSCTVFQVQDGQCTWPTACSCLASLLSAPAGELPRARRTRARPAGRTLQQTAAIYTSKQQRSKSRPEQSSATAAAEHTPMVPTLNRPTRVFRCQPRADGVG